MPNITFDGGPLDGDVLAIGQPWPREYYLHEPEVGEIHTYLRVTTDDTEPYTFVYYDLTPIVYDLDSLDGVPDAVEPYDPTGLPGEPGEPGDPGPKGRPGADGLNMERVLPQRHLFELAQHEGRELVRTYGGDVRLYHPGWDPYSGWPKDMVPVDEANALFAVDPFIATKIYTGKLADPLVYITDVELADPAYLNMIDSGSTEAGDERVSLTHTHRHVLRGWAFFNYACEWMAKEAGSLTYPSVHPNAYNVYLAEPDTWIPYSWAVSLARATPNMAFIRRIGPRVEFFGTHMVTLADPHTFYTAESIAAAESLGAGATAYAELEFKPGHDGALSSPKNLGTDDLDLLPGKVMARLHPDWRPAQDTFLYGWGHDNLVSYATYNEHFWPVVWKLDTDGYLSIVKSVPTGVWPYDFSWITMKAEWRVY